MIIKEFYADENICILRLDHYGRQLSHVMELVLEARKDFPTLKDEDITTVVYGGNYYSRTIGIEFNGVQKEGYSIVSRLELTR